MNFARKEKLLLWLNGLEILGILGVLFLAFAVQFLFNELPCPLCSLQRIGFVGIALGLLFNLRFGIRPAHYSFTLLSALFTAFVALRQMALHVLPGTDPYGSALFGLHFYTWSFIAAMLVLIYTAIVLGFGRQHQPSLLSSRSWRWASHLLFLALMAMIAANIVSTYYICGFGECPDNPTQYRSVSSEAAAVLV